MTFDPTKNRVPYGLLTEEERAALKAWPHGWEYFGRWPNGWNLCDSPEWASVAVYRGKPAPVVTSTWLNVYPTCSSLPYNSRKISDRAADSDRIAVLRIDTCNGVSKAHLEGVKNDLSQVRD